ncbi:MAG: DUF4401 domain-containing protein [Aggregatilineales bacterium]
MSRLTYFFAPPISDVLDQLEADELGDFGDRRSIEHLVNGIIPDARWYMQILSGFGAWISAICFFASVSLFVLGMFGDSEIDLALGKWMFLVLGLILYCGAIYFTWDLETRDTVFMSQLTLAVCLVAQLLIAGALGIEQDFNTIMLVLIIMEIILLVFYVGAIQRFISAGIITACLVSLILYEQVLWGLAPLTIFLAMGTVYVWIQHPFINEISDIRKFFRTLLYALPIHMLILLVLPLTNLEINRNLNISAFAQPLFVTATLLLLVLFVEGKIMMSYGISYRSNLALAIYAGTILIAVPSFSIPGIMGALLIMILGFWRNNAVMMGIATIFLAIFIGLFYYYLDTTLIVKGVTLILTGGIMLGLWLMTSLHNSRQKKAHS